MANLYQIIGVIVFCVVLVAGLMYWTKGRQAEPELALSTETEFSGPLTADEQQVIHPIDINPMNPKAIITTNQGVIELELFEDQMPITVGNFVKLAEANFYNGTKFHRVIPGFMIQGGDPNTKGDNEALYGMGGPAENIPDEFVSGELLTNVRGTIAMANTGQPNSGGSQFFINLADNTALDFDVPDPNNSRHPVFGRVVKGMEVVDAIAEVATDQRDIPIDPVVVESVQIVRQ